MAVQVHPLHTARNIAQAMGKAEREFKLEVSQEIESGQSQSYVEAARALLRRVMYRP